MSKILLISIVFSWSIMSIMSGCENDKPHLTVPEDKMIKIFYDLHTANYIVKKAPVDIRDSLSREYTGQIFENHNVSKEEFEKNLKILEKHPDYFVSFYKKLEKYSDSLMQKIHNQKPE